jgi:hypothetical protein
MPDIRIPKSSYHKASGRSQVVTGDLRLFVDH